MFENAIRLFTIRGFEVRRHFSWIIIAALLTWSLASGFFPAAAPGFGAGTYWMLGAIAALGLFACVVLHELAHAIIARRDHLPMKGITLFIFGGVTEMKDEPQSAKAEFRMAIAGPLTSIGLAVVFYAIFRVGAAAAWPIQPLVVLYYLAFINGLLAIFNLLPAFPLDGGRVLRSFFWHRRNDLRSATRTAATIGSGFSFLLMFLGIVSIFGGNIAGGLWWILIGMFLNGAAAASHQQVEIRTVLQGESVDRFIRENPVSVSSSTSIRDLIDEYVYRHHFSMFPVVDGWGRLLGLVTTKDLRRIPANEWSERPVSDIAIPCTADNTVNAGAPASDVLALMHRTNNTRLIVRNGDRLAGIVTLKDMLSYIALKVEIEGEEKERNVRFDKAA